MQFSPDLFCRVRSALERKGYCFLTGEEIDRLLAAVPGGWNARHRALREFASLCGAEVEATEHLKSARFVPAETGGAVEKTEPVRGFSDLAMGA